MAASMRAEVFRTSARILLAVMICVAFLHISVGAAKAQLSELLLQEEPFATWSKTAESAEESLRSDRASTPFLERLRNRLAEVRADSLQMSQTTDIAVRALQAQLTALGPAPAEGTEESPAVSDRRAQLVQRIAEETAPLIVAEGVFKRADILIKELDRRIRERETADLLTRYPSIVFVQYWPSYARELSDWVGLVSDDLRARFDDPRYQERLSDGLPIAIALTVLGFLLLVYGLPAATSRLEARRAAATVGPPRLWHALECAVARLIIPAFAAACLVFAWQSVFPAAGELGFLEDTSIDIAVDIILAYWLAHLVFSPTFPPHRIIDVDDGAAKRGFQIVIAIGVMSICEIILDRLDLFAQLSDGAISAVTIPFMILGGAFLWTLSRMLRARDAERDDAPTEAVQTDEPVSEIAVGTQFLALVRLGLVALCALVPVAAIVGYVPLARDTFDATVQTLALLTIALVIFNTLIGAAKLVSGDPQYESKERKTLLPIIIATLLGVALLPLLALVWGARATDIAEIWRLLSDGVQLGDARLSIDGFLTLIFVFFVGFFLTRWLQQVLRSTVLPRTRLDSGARNAVATGVGYVGFTLAAVLAISSAGVDLSSLAIVAGALSVGIGFGMQNIVSNFVSGIILLIERPVKQGDWIEVSGFSGYVRKISVRSTRIETFDRHDVIIPNADLISGAVKNMTLTSATGRVIVPVSIAYGSDLKRAREIMLTAAENHPQVHRYPLPHVLFMDMGESGLSLELRCFIKEINSMMMIRSDLMTEIYINLRDADIEIPFPQRDVHVRALPQQAIPADGS